MKTKEFRDIVGALDPSTMILIRTREGRTYEVIIATGLWMPEALPRTACIAVRGKGIAILDIKAIDSIQVETHQEK